MNNTKLLAFGLTFVILWALLWVVVNLAFADDSKNNYEICSS